ncbi:hypothetical protein MCAMS1_02811 [biofilm metagenome]
MPTLSQWQNSWQMLGTENAKLPIPLYHEVLAKYDEPHRFYHTQQHLTECLDNFCELRHLAMNPAEIELALWFHDAVYEPSRHDNELLSAEWAKYSIVAAGIDKAIADRIFQLILATQHHAKPDNTDTQILIDIDLAILGANPERYDEYEQQIRLEYAFVPESIFNAKRSEILQQFLAQPTIYNTPLFIERYEQQARTNINQAVAQLCKA